MSLINRRKLFYIPPLSKGFVMSGFFWSDVFFTSVKVVMHLYFFQCMENYSVCFLNIKATWIPGINPMWS